MMEPRILKPFFGLSNRVASIIVSFTLFGYAIYVIFSEGIVTSEYMRFLHVRDSIRKNEGNVMLRFSFESSTTSIFGLYEIEIAMIKACVSFLLFIVLLVGSTQKSKLILRIWMLTYAIVIILGFLATLVTLTDNYVQSSGTPTSTVNRFLITLAFSLWFIAIVLSLHEEIEYNEQISLDDIGSRNCKYIAKKGSIAESSYVTEKCPPYYDC